jgi:hypothetical protein
MPVEKNTGYAVPDVSSVQEFAMTQEQFRKEYGVDVNNQVRIVKLAHMRYQHPDLQEIKTFLIDFGMDVAKETPEEIWFSGYGEDQYVYYAKKGPRKFLGGCFEVESAGELENVSKLPNAGPIQSLEDAPGGGQIVTLHDPMGFPVNFMHGQEKKLAVEYRQPLRLNYEFEKPRIREFQRFKPGPAPVHKLGHFGLCVTDFESQLNFYIKNFNIVPTDFLYVGEGKERKTVGVFAHIDRGEELVDHHTFFMSTASSNHVHHCSFEVHDFDTQQLGHQWLASKGYKSVWGVGRHILGSQIFDYWWDTTGNMVEHYADGDVVNKHSYVDFCPAGNESLAVWGPELPKDFLD